MAKTSLPSIKLNEGNPPVLAVGVEGTFRCVDCTHLWTEQNEHTDCACCAAGHCELCGQQVCLCCEECEHYPCVCQKMKGGFRLTPPWVERGAPPITADDTYRKYSDWQSAWPLVRDEARAWCDPCQVAADFYLLDALRHSVVNASCGCTERCKHHIAKDSPTLRMIRVESNQLFDDLVGKLDPLFQQYVEMACGGELRHHGCIGGQVVSGERRIAWAQWRAVREYVGNQALLDMADLFMDWGKETGYGGPKWAEAARLLHDRVTGRITPPQWVDRVFTLVHNGGVFLNKVDWQVHNRKKWPLHLMQEKVLPAHASDGFGILLRVCSPEVKKLWDENWVEMNRERVRGGVRPQPNPRAVSRRRRMCAQCNSDATRGHTTNCWFFLQGLLPAKGESVNGYQYEYVVEEDEWSDYNWSIWQLTDYAVSPEGVFTPQSDTKLGAYLVVTKGWYQWEKRWNASVEQLLSTQWKAMQIPPTERKQMIATPGDVEWKLYILNLGGHVLGHVAGKVAADKFAKLILDIGLVAPLIETINWDAATTQYITNLSA